MGKKRARAVAERGYYNALQIKAFADSGVAPILPKPTTLPQQDTGRTSAAQKLQVFFGRDASPSNRQPARVGGDVELLECLWCPARFQE